MPSQHTSPEWSLNRTRQCAKCPWKKTTDPTKIPKGYSKLLHEHLEVTIAKPDQIRGYVHAMACHESLVGQETYCIGWLHNQLTDGNNIDLRLRVLSCSNINDIQLDGEQHPLFTNTLPKKKRRRPTT